MFVETLDQIWSDRKQLEMAPYLRWNHAGENHGKILTTMYDLQHLHPTVFSHWDLDSNVRNIYAVIETKNAIP